MSRCKDMDWNLPDVASWDRTNAALLMDIRDELKRLNTLLHCSNFTDIPRRLERIARNTTKRRKVGPKLRRVG